MQDCSLSSMAHHHVSFIEFRTIPINFATLFSLQPMFDAVSRFIAKQVIAKIVVTNMDDTPCGRPGQEGHQQITLEC